MIIFIYGPDAYRAHQYAQQLKARYQTKYPSGVNLVSIDMRQAEDVGTLRETFKSASFFEEVKLIVVRNGFATKEAAYALHELCNEFEARSRKDIVIMAIEPRSEKDLKSTYRDLFLLFTHESNTIKRCDFLAGAQLVRWISEEATALGSSLDPMATSLLVQRRGPDTWALHQELLKLSNYAHGRRVTKQDVLDLVPAVEDLNIFTLVEALASPGARGYGLLYDELHRGRDPYYILSMLTYQVRTMLAVKDCLERNIPSSDIAKRVMLHPFVVRKAIHQARSYSLADLRALFSKLVHIEQGTKQGLLNIQDDLYLLAVRTP